MRWISWCVFACVLATLVSCGDPGRKPPPEVVVQIFDEPGVYQINGERMFTADAYTALQKFADDNRRPTTSTSRVVVRVYYSNQVRYTRVQELLGWCGQMGLDKVTVQVREGVGAVPDANQSLRPRNMGSE